MKTKFTLIGLIAIAILGVVLFFSACNNGMNDVVIYHGQVVYINTTIPFADLTVKVTDGNDTHCQTQTDAGGQFSLKVRVNEINGSYYLLAGDETCIPKRVALGGYGQSEVDLGVIEVEGPALPTVITTPLQSVKADEAILGGEVQTNGRLAVTARGVCYGTEPYPTADGLRTTDGTGLGVFTSTLKNLEYNTIYYARAYATNKKGTAYGEQVKFTTEEGVAIVVTDSVIRITAHSAKCKGHVESDGGFPVTIRGACWSKRPDPTVDDDCTDDGSGLGEFTSTLKDLVENTTYYVRTYATNSTKTTYGEQVVITTLDGLAVVQTDSITSITATGFSAFGTVVSDCDIPVTARGFCYAPTQYPTIENTHTTVGKGLGKFQSNVTNLHVGTTYYVRAFATNETETSYGEQMIITTKDGLPNVETSSEVTQTALTITASGIVIEDGGFNITDRGICYSVTNTEPMITDKCASGGKGKGSFRVSIQELTPSTKYFLRAYATNENGTSYGAVITVTTQDGLPIISTTETTATSTTISSGGNITSDGGYNITARGVCYSTSNSVPTIEDNHTSSGVGVGEFSSIITSVNVSTTYYVRAYATNSIGTSYGDVVTVTTGNGLPSVSTTAVGENVTLNSAISGGQVTDDGGYIVTARGVCWNTLPYPTITDNRTTDGSGIGYYSSTITDINLRSNTYYVRAYATNQNGTTYGEQVLVSIENYNYRSLPIVEYGGYTYRIYPDLGPMTWDAANSACENLVYGGYSDWVLPSKDELSFIMTTYKYGWYSEDGSDFNFIPRSSAVKTAIKQSAYYWTSTQAPSTMHYYVYYRVESYHGIGGTYYYYLETPICSFLDDGNSNRVRPVRKYLANQ